MVYRFTTNGNCSACCLVIFCNQIQNGRFAGTGVPDNGRELLVWHCKGGVFQHRLSGHIGKVHTIEGNLMGSYLKRLHTASFLRLVHYTQDFVFGDHQVFITCQVYKNRVCQLCTEQGQHTNQKVVHRVQCPCDPGCIGQQDNQRAGQPTQNTKDRTNRKHF